MSPALDFATVAGAVGYSVERFRKIWTTLPGFPAPITRPKAGRGKYAWRPESVQAWLDARERALGSHAPPPAANDLHAPRAAHQSAVQRQRSVLGLMMARAR